MDETELPTFDSCPRLQMRPEMSPRVAPPATPGTRLAVVLLRVGRRVHETWLMQPQSSKGAHSSWEPCWHLETSQLRQLPGELLSMPLHLDLCISLLRFALETTTKPWPKRLQRLRVALMLAPKHGMLPGQVQVARPLRLAVFSSCVYVMFPYLFTSLWN